MRPDAESAQDIFSKSLGAFCRELRMAGLRDDRA